MQTYILSNPYPITSVGPVSADLDDYLLNPMSAVGDIIYGASAGAATRLAGNTTTTKKYLSQTGDGADSAAPTWATPAASEVSNTPAGTIAATEVQAAIDELNTDAVALAATVAAIPTSTYVTYSGATGTVNLGAHDLTTTGTITGNLITGVVPYTGATTNVNLGGYDLSCGKVTIGDAVVNASDAATKLYVDTEVAGIGVVFGTDARVVNLTTVKQGFIYDIAGNYDDSPATTTVTATALNTTGTVYYEFLLNDASVQNTVAITYTYTPQALYANMPDKIEVRIREGSDSGDILARDQMTMVGLKAGTHGATIILSNEAHTLPTTTAGIVTYTGSGTTISAWHGATQLLVDQNSTYGNSTFRVTNAVGSSITPDNAPSGADGTTTRVYGDASAMIADNASITFTIIIKDEAGTETTFTKIQSLAKSRQGNTGATGSSGPSPVYQGAYGAGTNYYGSANRVDIVLYGGAYWVSKPDAPVSPFSGQTPSESAYWTSFGATFESVATGLLFATSAYVDNLVVGEFSGIEATTGTLDGLPNTIQVAVASTPDIWTVTLTGGSSGTCDIDIDSTSQTVTWDTSLALSASNFVGTASYPGIVVSNPSGAIITFTKAGGEISLITVTESGITVDNVNGTQTGFYAAAVGQIDEVTLSGVGGRCTLNSNGAEGTVFYSYATQTGVSLTETAHDFVHNNQTEFNANNITLSSTGAVITLTETTPGGSAFSPATVSVHINEYWAGGVSIQENNIFEDKAVSGAGYIRINYIGYNGGTEYTRSLFIGDGQGGTLALFDGPGRKIYVIVPNAAGGEISGYLQYDGGFLKLVV